MPNQNKNLDSANLKNVYHKHGEIIGNMCKNVREMLVSDKSENVSKAVKNVKIVSDKPSKYTPEKIISDVSSALSSEVNSDPENSPKKQDGGGFIESFSYKVNIFGFEISAWVIILIFFVVMCAAYIIYKFFLSKNSIKVINKKNKIKFDEDEGEGNNNGDDNDDNDDNNEKEEENDANEENNKVDDDDEEVDEDNL